MRQLITAFAFVSVYVLGFSCSPIGRLRTSSRATATSTRSPRYTLLDFSQHHLGTPQRPRERTRHNSSLHSLSKPTSPPPGKPNALTAEAIWNLLKTNDFLKEHDTDSFDFDSLFITPPPPDDPRDVPASDNHPTSTTNGLTDEAFRNRLTANHLLYENYTDPFDFDSLIFVTPPPLDDFRDALVGVTYPAYFDDDDDDNSSEPGITTGSWIIPICVVAVVVVLGYFVTRTFVEVSNKLRRRRSIQTISNRANLGGTANSGRRGPRLFVAIVAREDNHAFEDSTSARANGDASTISVDGADRPPSYGTLEGTLPSYDDALLGQTERNGTEVRAQVHGPTTTTTDRHPPPYSGTGANPPSYDDVCGLMPSGQR